MATATETTKSVGRSFPFLPILSLIFVVAKITGYITWSWWLVFLPVIIGYSFLFVGLILIAIAAAAKA